MEIYLKHHQADNGRFKDKLFMNDIEDKGQTISFMKWKNTIKME
jgi:hypothetical protein